jgi:hypothetical protein
MVAPIAAVIAAWVFTMEFDKIHLRAWMGFLGKGRNSDQALDRDSGE